MTNITKESLDSLGIYELRSIARQVGVYLPTTYKKDDLIEKIISIYNGVETPYVRKGKQGRPAKNIAGLDEILNIFVPDINPNSNYADRVIKEHLFSTAFMQDIKGLPENMEEFSGFVKMQSEKFAVVFKNGYFNGNKETYYITPQLLSQLNLKDGDYVVGQYYFISKDKPQIVQAIKYINNISYDIFKLQKRQNFESLDALYPTKQIKLAQNEKSLVDFRVIDKISPIGEGSRVLINYEKNYDIEDFIINLSNALSLNNNYSTSLIAVNERPEDLSIIKYECTGLKDLCYSQNLSDDQFAERLQCTFDNIIRQVENNKPQVLIIKNLNKLINFLTNYYSIKNNIEQRQANMIAVEKVKNYLLEAKNTKENLSLTIIAFYSSYEEINDLFNTHIQIKNESYENTDLKIDIEKSYTIKTKLLFNENDYKKHLDFKKNYIKNSDIKLLENIL